jgi:hypothetical protein
VPRAATHHLRAASAWLISPAVTCKKISHFVSADNFDGRRRPLLDSGMNYSSRITREACQHWVIFHAHLCGEVRRKPKGHEKLPGGGRESCPLVATRSARLWPPNVPGWLGQGVHPLAGHGLGETHALAAGLADVGVVQEPVDGGGDQGLGHELIESGGVEVAA